jgi:hypothetical protein
LTSNIEEYTSESEREVLKIHLDKLFNSILPIHEELCLSKEIGRIPKFGSGLNKVQKKVHNTLFEWNCFRGSERKFETSKIVKQKVDKKDQKLKDKEEIEQELNFSFIKAPNTFKQLKGCSFLAERKFSPNQQLYFGIGDSNHFLYLLKIEGKKIDYENSIRIFFNGNFAAFTSFNLDQIDEKADNNSEKENLETHYLKRVDFLNLARGLIRDLMEYSTLTRNELTAAQKSVDTSSNDSVKSYSELLNLWLKVIKFSESEFESALQHAQVDKTLVGVIVTSIISAFFVPVIMRTGNNIIPISKLASYFSDSNAAFLGLLILLIICVVTLLPIGFFVGNSLIYLVSRISSGQGSFDNQTFLSSLIFVPICGFIILGLLLGVIPVIGGFLSGILLFLSFVSIVVLHIRVVKVTHQLPNRRATIVVLLPIFFVLLFVISLLTMVFVLL